MGGVRGWVCPGAVRDGGVARLRGRWTDAGCCPEAAGSTGTQRPALAAGWSPAAPQQGSTAERLPRTPHTPAVIIGIRHNP